MKDYHDFVRGHDCTDRPNLIATPRGRREGRSIIWKSHAHAMPAGDIDGWSYGPWAEEVVDGVMYGPQIFHVSDGAAAMVLATWSLRDAGLELDGGGQIQSVVGEEGGQREA